MINIEKDAVQNTVLTKVYTFNGFKDGKVDVIEDDLYRLVIEENRYYSVVRDEDGLLLAVKGDL